jgi:hypothetical protein
MQNGSVIRAERQRGPHVWEFRWRERGADGKRKHRRMVLGSVEQLADKTVARQAIAALRLDLNLATLGSKCGQRQSRSLCPTIASGELEPDTISICAIQERSTSQSNSSSQ